MNLLIANILSTTLTRTIVYSMLSMNNFIHSNVLVESI